MKTKQTHSVGIASELAVVGYNPESADMDNPRGEIVRERFYLLAEDARGNRKRAGWFETALEAERWYNAGPDALPVFLWQDTDPCYGSPAWEAYGEDAQIEREARQREDESWGFDTRFTRY